MKKIIKRLGNITEISKGQILIDWRCFNIEIAERDFINVGKEWDVYEIVEEKESKTKITNQNHKPMNYILKGLDKYGMTKYQSRVFNKIEKLRELRAMNIVTFPFLTFIIYDQNGKTYL